MGICYVGSVLSLRCLDLTRCDVNSPWLSLSVCGVQLLEILWLLHF